MNTDSNELRKEIIDTALWLSDIGYVYGTWGNISVRLKNGNILITPSRLEYSLMKPEDLSVIAPDGKVVSGSRLPTSERELHRGILERRADINAVIHTHSPYAMAAAALELDGGIPAISEEMCQLIGGSIPLTKRFVPSEDHKGLGEMAADSIGIKNALLIRNHGAVCCGATLREARICCQVVEKSSLMFINITGERHISIIDDKYVTAGRIYYAEGYGKT